MNKSTKPTTTSDAVKRLLEDPAGRIRLDDFVMGHLKRALASLALEQFPTSVPVSEEALPLRLKQYEAAVRELITIVVLLARWGRGAQLSSLEKVFSHLAAVDKGSGGTVLWLRLGWYPLQLLMYAAGIAAVDAKNYDALATISLTPVSDEQRSSGAQTPLVVRVSGAMSEISDAFKRLPGREREHVPRSEYLFTLLRDPLENELFLGSNYEAMFDRFEVLIALVYADMTYDTRGGWGPIGRFGWKHGRGNGGGPYDHVTKEIQKMGAAWPPLKSGLFGGKADQASEIAKAFAERLGKLNWW